MLRRTRPVAAWVLGLLAMLVVTAPLAGADDYGPPAVLAVAAESGVAYALVSVSDWKTTSGVYRSLDSGTTWERVDEIPATLHTSLYSRLHRRGRLVRCESVDTSICYLERRHGDYVISDDGGVTWLPLDDSPGGTDGPASVLASESLLSVRCDEAGDLCYRNMYDLFGRSRIEISGDGGRTWHLGDRGNVQYEFDRIYDLDGLTCVADTPNRCYGEVRSSWVISYERSDDGGLTWAPWQSPDGAAPAVWTSLSSMPIAYSVV